MNTQVTFRSSKFPALEGEEEQINPGIWGKLLSDYVVENLKKEGFDVKDVGPEDWGYLVELANDGFLLGVGCSHYQGGDDDEFVCIITPDKPVIRRMFKKFDTTAQVGRVEAALDKILKSDPDIREVHWD